MWRKPSSAPLDDRCHFALCPYCRVNTFISLGDVILQHHVTLLCNDVYSIAIAGRHCLFIYYIKPAFKACDIKYLATADPPTTQSSLAVILLVHHYGKFPWPSLNRNATGFSGSDLTSLQHDYLHSAIASSKNDLQCLPNTQVFSLNPNQRLPSVR